MKSLKYEGVVRLKIFWSLRRLEAGLNGLKIKRVHYGKIELQIIREPPYFSDPNAPSPFSLNIGPSILLLLLRLRSTSSSSSVLHVRRPPWRPPLTATAARRRRRRDLPSSLVLFIFRSVLLSLLRPNKPSLFSLQIRRVFRRIQRRPTRERVSLCLFLSFIKRLSSFQSCFPHTHSLFLLFFSVPLCFRRSRRFPATASSIQEYNFIFKFR